MAATYYKLLKEDGDALLLESGDFILLENYWYDSQTKSLQYTVEDPNSLTKSLQYAVERTPSAITKGLIYRVKTVPSAKTKSLQYTIERGIAITKSLKYCVEITPSAKTKSLAYYIVKTPTAMTKSLQYTVEKGIAITKSLKYTLETTPSAITKSLQYAIETTPTATTKSLQYVLRDGLYTKEQNASLPTDADNLTTEYTNPEYEDVELDDEEYVDQLGSAGNFTIHEFKKYNVNATDGFDITVNLKSSKAGSDSTIYLQVYNYDTDAWETLDSNNTVAADTDFDLTGNIPTVDGPDYYDADLSILCRVYQQNL